MAKTPPASNASARGSDDLEALHAALDSRLATLEAALADPNEVALEDLILDLARAATQEAEAVARRASLQARADADAQAGSALSQLQVAQAALESERHAGLELHRSLGAARSELEAAKQKAMTATQELERLRESFSIERTTLRGELSEAERCFAAADTRRQQVEEARDEEVARERATVQRLTDALAKARGEIDAARQDVTSRAADMEAARERADTAARSLADLNQSLNEARARADTVSQERDRLKADLEASATASQTAAKERSGVEQKWHEAEARATTIVGERDRLAGERDRLNEERDRLTGERDRLAGEKDRLATEKERLAAEKDRLIADRDRLTREREAVSAQLETARQGATTAAAAAQAIETQRAALEQTLHEVEASNDTGLREVEARIEVIVRQHAEIVAERDAALDARDALVAERDAANARHEAAEAERNAAVAQLEAARQGSTTANAAIQSLDAHRATLEQNWQSAEARADVLARERDAAVAQRDAAVAERADAVASADALRKAVDNAQETSRARFSELRQRTERQIQNLEAQLLGEGEDGPEIDVSLDDGDDAGAAIEIEAMEPDEPIVASKPSRGAHAAPPASFSPSRVASRHGFREPLEVKLDGQTALLIDISTSGAQVLSSGALKPNKPVKMLLPSTGAILLCQAKIVWSRFEPPTPGKPMRYRAGMVFTQADAAALQVFITRHSGVKLGLGAAVGAPPTTEERKTGRLISVPFNSATGKSRRAEPRDPMSSIDFDFPAKQRRE